MTAYVYFYLAEKFGGVPLIKELQEYDPANPGALVVPRSTEYDTWDYVITVCGSANETCPAFAGNVGKRLHIGFDDPSEAIGTTDFIRSEFERVRNEIRNEFTKFYLTEIKKQELPKCACNR